MIAKSNAAVNVTTNKILTKIRYSFANIKIPNKFLLSSQNDAHSTYSLHGKSLRPGLYAFQKESVCHRL
jgi:hypothetical protein